MTTGTNFGPDLAPIRPQCPTASETLPALEQRLTERLLAFERLDEPAARVPRCQMSEAGTIPDVLSG